LRVSRPGVGAYGKSEQETRLSDGIVSNEQNFEQVLTDVAQCRCENSRLESIWELRRVGGRNLGVMTVRANLPNIGPSNDQTQVSYVLIRRIGISLRSLTIITTSSRFILQDNQERAGDAHTNTPKVSKSSRHEHSEVGYWQTGCE